MKRKVYIVQGNFHDKDEEKYDDYYINQYKVYFSSNAGGAYEDHEIEILKMPSQKELENTVLSDQLDYSIIVYLGHGATNNGVHIFELNENEIIQAGQYLTSAEKQIIVLESCRDIIHGNIPAVTIPSLVPKFEKGGVVRKPLKRDLVRRIYDDYINRCDQGIMICLPCKVNESAYNYYFTVCFISLALQWHVETHRHQSILPIDELMGNTTYHVHNLAQADGYDQHPNSINPINFPIGVSRF